MVSLPSVQNMKHFPVYYRIDIIDDAIPASVISAIRICAKYEFIYAIAINVFNQITKRFIVPMLIQYTAEWFLFRIVTVKIFEYISCLGNKFVVSRIICFFLRCLNRFILLLRFVKKYTATTLQAITATVTVQNVGFL